MPASEKLFIAGIGMISSVGANTEMTVASVKAGISGYKISNYYGETDKPITMANIPDAALAEIEAEIDEGDVFCERHYRITLMAISAVREACESVTADKVIPIFLAMPDVKEDTDGLSPLIYELERNCQPWVNKQQSRHIYTGRAAGMDAIDFAFRMLESEEHPYILIGGTDSYQDYDRITPLAEKDRLMEEDNMDGFAPGEAACFILLTPYMEQAMEREGHIIALHPPGIAIEPGHLYSNEPYRGEGLDQAFKKTLQISQATNIHSIYSSMNGENHWAKELGVAFTRNKAAFVDTVKTEHPADILGDTGSATASLLIALAAKDLYKNNNANQYLVYSSSDTIKRGAIVLEKLPAIVKH